MSINNAITAGLAGNELSKKITGTDETSLGRTIVASGSGAVLSGGAVAVAAAGISVTAGAVVVPVAVAGAIVGGIASLFD